MRQRLKRLCCKALHSAEDALYVLLLHITPFLEWAFREEQRTRREDDDLR